MMNARLLLSTALALASFSLPAFAADQSARCDLLAASPIDTARPQGVAGVTYGDIVVPEAEVACRDAWEASGDPRMAYQLGRVLDQDLRLDEARAFYEMAVTGGYVEAKVNLAHVLTDIAHEQAAKLYSQAAKDGSTNAIFNLAVFARDNDHNATEALSLFGQAAALGDAEAAYNIAVIYDEGELVVRDVAQAKRYYEQAVEGDFSWARINLGYLLLEGSPDSAEQQRALALFRAAAIDDGDVNAGLQLGIMLQNGSAAEQDESEALVLAALQARDFELARKLQQADTGLSERNLAAISTALSAASMDEVLAKLPTYYSANR